MTKIRLHKEVFEANEGFYQAFESLDIKLMDRVWAQDDRVQCVHPGWGGLTGWPSVRDSWVRIFNHTLFIKFTVSDLHISGDEGVAWVVCTENIETQAEEPSQKSRILATNIFEKRNDLWKMVHHHGSPVLTNPSISST
ncbi:MAG TPA: nuclear transport factor 2 family protein [Nitrospiria bacterium]|jgi:ketosteroid isomerase-like protein